MLLLYGNFCGKSKAFDETVDETYTKPRTFYVESIHDEAIFVFFFYLLHRSGSHLNFNFVLKWGESVVGGRWHRFSNTFTTHTNTRQNKCQCKKRRLLWIWNQYSQSPTLNAWNIPLFLWIFVLNSNPYFASRLAKRTQNRWIECNKQRRFNSNPMQNYWILIRLNCP